jgi:tetratricopeptide (TPR) repeat protein
MNRRLPWQLPALLLILAAAPVDEEAELRRLALSLNSIISSTAQDAKVEELAKDQVRAKKLLALAKKLNEEKNSPLAYSANYILGCVALELRDVENGNALFAAAVKQAELLKSDQKAAYAYFNWIDLNASAKNYDEAEKLCQKLLEREADEEGGSWARIAQAMGLRKLSQVTTYRGKPDEALKKLADERYDQKNPFILETKAWVHSYAGQYDEAIAVYEELLQRVGDRESQARERDRYTRMLGSLHGDLGRVDKANAVMEPLLKKNPDDDALKNDLGYIWADNGVRLDEAEKLIRQAVEAQPTNGNFLDSLAWVYYKQKKYGEAKQTIMKAIALPRTQNAEIYEHVGAIHLALNEKDQAKAAWKKAIDLASGSARDQKRKAELEKKLKELGD